MKFTTSALLPVAVLAASASASPILTEEKRSAFPSVTVIDDASSDLTYSAGWTHLTNQGFKLNGKTESYTGVNGEVRFNNPVEYGGKYGDSVSTLTIWSTKKKDRGDFNVYCGHKLVGSGNQYSSTNGETDTQVVANFTGYDCTESYLVMKNDRGAKYMALDKIEFSGYYGI